MRVSLRESRMVLERLMLAAGVPEGMVPSLRDSALYSAVLGLAGFARVEAEIALLRSAAACAMTFDGATLRAGGAHSWLAAEPAVDLAVAASRGGDAPTLDVVDMTASQEFAVAAAIAAKHGVTASLAPISGGFRLSVAAAGPADPLDAIRRDGLSVETTLWWRLYHASAAALAVDTVESRRHAGPIRVEADGRIVGRQDDDETDLSLLVGAPRPARPNV